jgi:arylformamidase
MTAHYLGMDRTALDAAYDNLAAVKDSQDYRARWWEASAAIRSQPQSRLNLRYGTRPRGTLDYFPSAATKSPLLVFIHGGYWQRNEKERFSFVATGPRAHGINVAVPGYTLAPDARLRDIVAEIRQALTFLVERADELGFDSTAVFVGGWSAGGHLTAVVSDHPSLSALNDKLSLDAEEIVELSPLKCLAIETPPLRLFVGGAELPELRRQSEAYAQAAGERGLPVSLTVPPGHHHFSILDELSDPNGALTHALRDLIMSAA